MTSPNFRPEDVKVCPVSGMFLEEPLRASYYWYANGNNATQGQYLNEEYEHQSRFMSGNCFLEARDAFRYAKHLKAMAKLRRLGGVLGGSVYVPEKPPHGEYAEIYMAINHDILLNLTPEEQNALLWPNEEK